MSDKFFRLPEFTIHDRLTALSTDVRPWSIDQRGVRELGAQRGKGSKWLVIDTGYSLHPDLSNVVEARDFTRSRSGHADIHGHSTHVQSILGGRERDGRYGPGVAPGVLIYSAKALGDDGVGPQSAVAQAIYWGIELGVDGINLSLGSGQPSREIEQAVRDAFQAGIVLVCAAGNFGDSRRSWPAMYPETISVAATDINDRAADFSEPSAVNVAAPGVKILASYLNGQYSVISGTSQAAPWVSGMLAIYFGELRQAGKPLPKPADVPGILKLWADDIHTPGHDAKTGHGLVSVERYKETAPKPPEDVKPVGKVWTLGPLTIHWGPCPAA